MDLRALKYLTEAVKHGSISRAAVEIGIAQPALSRQIRLLEDELGVKLLVRGRSGTHPTNEGMRFIAGAEKLLRMAEELRREARADAHELVGTIRLGYLPATSDVLVASLIADFVAAHPKVKFHLHEAGTHGLGHALGADAIDIAIMDYDYEQQGVQKRPLFEENIWLSSLPSMWPFQKTELTPADLVDLPLIHTKMIGAQLDKITDRKKGFRRSVIEGETKSVIRAAVCAGTGFMVAPASAVVEDINLGTLVGAPISGFEVRRGLFIRSDRMLSQTLLSFFRELDMNVERLKTKMVGAIRDIQLVAENSRETVGAPAGT